MSCSRIILVLMIAVLSSGVMNCMPTTSMRGSLDSPLVTQMMLAASPDLLQQQQQHPQPTNHGRGSQRHTRSLSDPSLVFSSSSESSQLPMAVLFDFEGNYVPVLLLKNSSPSGVSSSGSENRVMSTEKRSGNTARRKHPLTRYRVMNNLLFSSWLWSMFSNLNQIQMREAMGIDLPDFMLRYNGKLPAVIGSYREKMERNG